MRQLFARPAIALLTFFVGVALASCLLLIRKSKPATPPCDHTEAIPDCTEQVNNAPLCAGNGGGFLRLGIVFILNLRSLNVLGDDCDSPCVRVEL